MGQEVINWAKVHLVDLAGSERVSKTRVVGTVLSEAKHINLSLHFLEQVIISLQVTFGNQVAAYCASHLAAGGYLSSVISLNPTAAHLSFHAEWIHRHASFLPGHLTVCSLPACKNRSWHSVCVGQERDGAQGRAHIPFRNSMLTTALRDSLGGNCRTVMVANVAATSDQAEETISTCRFAQRVAMISNTVWTPLEG